MESPPHPHSDLKNWPPERGWPLFLTWMAAIVAMQLIDGTVVAMLVPSLGSGGMDWKMRIPSTVLAIIVHAWQAWLLFRKHPARFACWTLLPLILGFLPYTLNVMQYIGLAVPLIEAAILQGVRRRAWAWILAGMAGVVFTQCAYSVLYGMGGYDTIRRFIESSFGNSPVAPLLAIGVLFRGIWILTEAISAAVLAWKMPPIVASDPDQKTDAV